ncbi:hypothetical protein IMSHALPRED_007857 [Imshaugia aleurites]|uniref:Uncharacterized protein n=1 Tax=Imshaugia aleurites TaxID=172621 RepID=A0A8H3IRU3_9LECA|nr:hypothetical protein IMSHALPRED_007857 [Imshaugia aleurites]
MTSTVPKLTPLGDSKHGGALLTLPRQIRDEIYRLLVKGRYLVHRQSNTEPGVSFLKGGTEFDEPDLVILQISRLISSEAQDVLYSESIFRYIIPTYLGAALRPQIEAVNRMKKIEVHINPEYDYGFEKEARTLIQIPRGASIETIFDDFAGMETLRESLHINSYWRLDYIGSLGTSPLPALSALNGFRTIAIKIIPRKVHKDQTNQELSKYISSNEELKATFERLRQEIKAAIKPS